MPFMRPFSIGNGQFEDQILIKIWLADFHLLYADLDPALLHKTFFFRVFIVVDNLFMVAYSYWAFLIKTN